MKKLKIKSFSIENKIKIQKYKHLLVRLEAHEKFMKKAQELYGSKRRAIDLFDEIVNKLEK